MVLQGCTKDGLARLQYQDSAPGESSNDTLDDNPTMAESSISLIPAISLAKSHEGRFCAPSTDKGIVCLA
jgi:hypothetical protein